MRRLRLVDSLGLTGLGFACLVALGILAFSGLLTGTAKLLSEASCNQRANVLRVEGDYRFLSGECYLTLDNGTVIPASQYRATEDTTR